MKKHKLQREITDNKQILISLLIAIIIFTSTLIAAQMFLDHDLEVTSSFDKEE